MQINPETFNAVYDKLGYASKYKIYSFDGFDPKRREQIVKKWVELNLLSYNRRYKQADNKADIELFVSLVDVYAKRKPITLCQLLKHLECIDYNIEYYDDVYEIKLLRSTIDDIKTSIISEMEEYEKAKWE